MIKLFLNRSIKTKIVWISVVISMIPLLLLAMLFYKTSTELLETTMYRNADQNADYLSEYLDKYFSNFSYSALQVYGFKNIMNLMENGNDYNNADIINVRDSLSNYFRLLQSQNEDIIKIMLYGKKNTLEESWSRASIYDSIQPVKEIPHSADLLNLPFQHTFMTTYKDSVLEQSFFVYAITVYDPYYKYKIGTILFIIQNKDVQKIVEKYNRASNAIVLQNSRGDIFYQTNTKYDQDIKGFSIPATPISKVKRELKFNDQRELLIGTSYLDHGNMKLDIVYPSTELNKNRKYIFNLTLLILFVVILIIYLFSLMSQHYITKPIQLLGRAMSALRNGNFAVSLKVNDWSDDISQLSRNFNFMTRKISDLIESEYEMKLRNKEAQIIALQTQINPHFLFNTLQTIGGKAVLNGEYEIHEMCRALGDMFRYSFYEGNKESTLGAELLHINNYLYIQKFRFEELLQTEIDVAEEFRDYPMIRFVLQPIIENAIIHSLGKTVKRELHLHISAIRDTNNIIILVKDDGPGIEANLLAEMQDVLDQKSLSVYSGVSIGLKNVHERLQMVYGSMYGIHVESILGQGTSVYITIPYAKRGNNHV
ncbi:two-component system sensor histidine kinase YesM [Paenibacillus sp. V4I3]|uniref:sensor histidine kinase n=1 Tax=Paenibacillus sp. V4I3 TaxID=3042305 RepID=UPI00278548F5|nr:histidine kinase [Paenibacillus sp. V4I3]MDQ0877830.1 two-component system sensor histidine kinase YesM [Paenibacillus sp. V4I3]